MTVDVKILELSIKKLSESFDEFICECVDKDGKPKQPTMQAIMKAKGYLPPYCAHAFKKEPVEIKNEKPCDEHGIFPCRKCGTKHYDECRCYFCKAI